MVLLLDKLQQTIPLNWIRDHVTIYAADHHFFCLFKDETELHDALRFFDAILAIGQNRDKLALESGVARFPKIYSKQST